MAENIDWSRRRRVYQDKNSLEYWVRVEMGWMLDDDYIEGGKVYAPIEMNLAALEYQGKFTNAQIQNFDHRGENR